MSWELIWRPVVESHKKIWFLWWEVAWASTHDVMTERPSPLKEANTRSFVCRKAVALSPVSVLTIQTVLFSPGQDLFAVGADDAMLRRDLWPSRPRQIAVHQIPQTRSSTVAAIGQEAMPIRVEAEKANTRTVVDGWSNGFAVVGAPKLQALIDGTSGQARPSGERRATWIVP